MTRSLIAQIEGIKAGCTEKSFNTRRRYYQGMERFCAYCAKEYHVQKITNIRQKHFSAYAEYLKSSGYSASTIKTDLSGIRFFLNKSDNQHGISKNDVLDLPKRQIGQIDRAWTKGEIESAIKLANAMGRQDVSFAIKMASTWGLRIHEVCKCQANHLQKALEFGELYTKGKGGQERYISLKTAEQKDLCRELLAYAKKHNRKGTDRVLFDNIRGATQKQIKSVQNWIANHRAKFQDLTRENTLENERLSLIAKANGIKLKTDTITIHGCRHYYCQTRYKYYLKCGDTKYTARLKVSEELGHHRVGITAVYLV